MRAPWQHSHIRAGTTPAEVGDRDRRVGWMAAYACGVAWAGIDPADSTAEILEVADGDPGLIEAALFVVHGLESLDDRARRRACFLLQRTLANPELNVATPTA